MALNNCSTGTVTLTVRANSVRDKGGNWGPVTAVSAPAATVDRAPLPTFTAPASPTASAILSYGVAFSEPVTGLESSDISTGGMATGCSVATPEGSGAAYTVSVSGCSDGTVVLSLAASSVIDAGGTPGPTGRMYAPTVTVDRTASTPPTATLAAPATPTNAATLSYGVAFSEPVTGLTASGLSISGTATGCAVGTPAGSGTAYTADVSGCSEGTVVLTLRAGSVADTAGNPGPAADVAAEPVTVDRTPPAAFLTAPASPTSATILSYGITLSEPAGYLTAADFSVSGTATGCLVGDPIPAALNATIRVTGCSEGTVTLVLKAGSVADAAGNLGPAADVVASAVTVDRAAPTAPIVIAIRLRPGAALSGTAVPATVTWTPSLDGTSGAGLAASPYTLQRSLSGGAWTTLGRYPGTAAAVSLPASGTVRFRVLAVDAAGNTATGTPSPSRSAGLVQQSSTAVRYSGSWYAASSTAFSGGSVKWAKAAGTSASYTFTGRGVALVTTRAPSRGRVKVYVDGVYAATVDLYRVSTQYRALAWARTWTSSRTHTLRLVVVGTAGRPRVDLDALAVLR